MSHTFQRIFSRKGADCLNEETWQFFLARKNLSPSYQEYTTTSLGSQLPLLTAWTTKVIFSTIFFSRSLLASWISPNRSKIIWNFFYEKKSKSCLVVFWNGDKATWNTDKRFRLRLEVIFNFFSRVNLRKMVWVPTILGQNLKILVFCAW